MREQEPDEAMTELIRNFLEPASFYQVHFICFLDVILFVNTGLKEQALKNIGIDFYTGVPDSLLKDFCAYVTANCPADRHVITANEGAAIALASGHYMATKKWPLVYLQNSGLGNTVNPIMSLAHPEVYRYTAPCIDSHVHSVPMLLMVGWRGEPGKKDEPQHVIQGEGTPALLASLGVPFQVLPDYIEGAEKALQVAKKYKSSQGMHLIAQASPDLPRPLCSSREAPNLCQVQADAPEAQICPQSRGRTAGTPSSLRSARHHRWHDWHAVTRAFRGARAARAWP